MNEFPLLNMYQGKIATHYGIDTAIKKQPTNADTFLSVNGLANDQCADKKHHGGKDRALHHYPFEHYRYWQNKYKNNVFSTPGMGENISTLGMTEENVYIGDRFQWGEAIIEVSQPRSPCFKLNKRWNIEAFSVEMQKQSRCGWLYRVIQEGIVGKEHSLKFIERPSNAMTIKAVCDIYFNDPLNKPKLLILQQQSKLCANWLTTINQRLESKTLENWNFRLLGHA